jgi:hypothetical protein
MSHEQFQSCIEECIRCMQACNHCYDACLKEDHVAMMKECIRLDRECADICAFAAQVMSMNSSYAKEICRICADACEACGNECSSAKEQRPTSLSTSRTIIPEISPVTTPMLASGVLAHHSLISFSVARRCWYSFHAIIGSFSFGLSGKTEKPSSR